MLIEYHGGGDPNSALVEFQTRQIAAELESDTERGMRKWWDYSILFRSRDMLYRTWLLVLTQVFSQFIGGSVIRYGCRPNMSQSKAAQLIYQIATTCPLC
jgi:hypothetical protein